MDVGVGGNNQPAEGRWQKGEELQVRYARWKVRWQMTKKVGDVVPAVPAPVGPEHNVKIAISIHAKNCQIGRQIYIPGGAQDLLGWGPSPRGPWPLLRRS